MPARLVSPPMAPRERATAAVMRSGAKAKRLQGKGDGAGGMGACMDAHAWMRMHGCACMDAHAWVGGLSHESSGVEWETQVCVGDVCSQVIG